MQKVLALDTISGDSALVKLHAGVSTPDATPSSATEGGAAIGDEVGSLPSVSVSVHDWAFAVCADASLAPPTLAPSTSSTATPTSATGSSAGSTMFSRASLLSEPLQSTSMERQLDASTAWDELRADYSVEWPLHLVLTQDAAAQYNKLFGLLWKTKRTCVEIELLFPKFMEPQYRRFSARDSVWLRPLQVLHGQMLFFLQNLFSYLQVDVVEAAHRELIGTIDSQQDFDAVRRAHATYLATMCKKSHVGVRPLMDGLKRIMRLCRHFSILVNTYSSAADIPHPEVNYCTCLRIDVCPCLTVPPRRSSPYLGASGVTRLTYSLCLNGRTPRSLLRALTTTGGSLL